MALEKIYKLSNISSSAQQVGEWTLWNDWANDRNIDINAWCPSAPNLLGLSGIANTNYTFVLSTDVYDYYDGYYDKYRCPREIDVRFEPKLMDAYWSTGDIEGDMLTIDYTGQSKYFYYTSNCLGTITTGLGSIGRSDITEPKEDSINSITFPENIGSTPKNGSIVLRDLSGKIWKQLRFTQLAPFSVTPSRLYFWSGASSSTTDQGIIRAQSAVAGTWTYPSTSSSYFNISKSITPIGTGFTDFTIRPKSDNTSTSNRTQRLSFTFQKTIEGGMVMSYNLYSQIQQDNYDIQIAELGVGTATNVLSKSVPYTTSYTSFVIIPSEKNSVINENEDSTTQITAPLSSTIGKNYTIKCTSPFFVGVSGYTGSLNSGAQFGVDFGSQNLSAYKNICRLELTEEVHAGSREITITQTPKLDLAYSGGSVKSIAPNYIFLDGGTSGQLTPTNELQFSTAVSVSVITTMNWLTISQPNSNMLSLTPTVNTSTSPRYGLIRITSGEYSKIMVVVQCPNKVLATSVTNSDLINNELYNDIPNYLIVEKKLNPSATINGSTKYFCTTNTYTSTTSKQYWFYFQNNGDNFKNGIAHYRLHFIPNPLYSLKKAKNFKLNIERKGSGTELNYDYVSVSYLNGNLPLTNNTTNYPKGASANKQEYMKQWTHSKNAEYADCDVEYKIPAEGCSIDIAYTKDSSGSTPSSTSTYMVDEATVAFHYKWNGYYEEDIYDWTLLTC